MMKKCIHMLTIILFYFPTNLLASSWCNCEGEATVESYSAANEKTLHINSLSCNGHGCCPTESARLVIKKNDDNSDRTAITFEGSQRKFDSLTVGKKTGFTFQCSDSATPKGITSSSVLSIK